MTIDYRRAKDVVETWNFEKVHGREFNRMDMRKFVTINNDRSKQLILAVSEDARTPEEFQRIGMLANDAITFVSPVVLDVPDERWHEIRNFINEWGISEAEFYTGLMELCVHAATILTPKARVIADGIDRTDV